MNGLGAGHRHPRSSASRSARFVDSRRHIGPRTGSGPYTEHMRDALRLRLAQETGLLFGVLFGSHAQGQVHAGSDVDIAVALAPGSGSASRLGHLAADLERIAGAPVDLVVLAEAGPPLRYRVLWQGEPLQIGDRRAFVTAKARALVEYLDFKPIEDRCAQGVLEAAARG